MWTLVISGPKIATQRRALTPGAVLVAGRAPDNDLVLPSDCVSRRHAQFSAGADGVRVSDLGSRNGTLLNGHALGGVSRSLALGDVAAIGDYVVKVEGEPAEASAAEGFVTLRTSALDDNPYVTRFDRRLPPVPHASASAAGAPVVDPQYAPLLDELAERLAHAPPLLRFLSEVLDCAVGVTGFEGVLLLRREGGGYALAPVSCGVDPRPFRWSDTLVGAAVERRQTLFVNHLGSDARFRPSESILLANHQRVLCAPLMRGEEALGALYLATHGGEVPSQSTLEFVTAIAQLAAVAVERERAAQSVAPADAPGTPLEGIGAGARRLEDVLDALERTLAPQGDDPRVTDLLEEARAAVERITAELARASRAAGTPTTH